MQENRKRLFAISDLHLPGGKDKYMDIFGAQWEGHFDKIKVDWVSRVEDDDIVLIPGDISWAMTLEGAVEDLLSIGELPGYKVLLRGNHDYWWSSISKLRSVLPEKMYAIQNDAILIRNYAICGSRGWAITEGETAEADKKIYDRELIRMEMSLNRANVINDGRKIIAMMHFPPLDNSCEDTLFTSLFEKHGVSYVVYGHLHDRGTLSAFCGVKSEINYQLVSCDYLGFKLFELGDF